MWSLANFLKEVICLSAAVRLDDPYRFRNFVVGSRSYDTYGFEVYQMTGALGLKYLESC